MGFLIDTCIWVDVERGAIAPADVSSLTQEEPVFLSPVTIAELEYGVQRASKEAIKSKRRAALEKLRQRPTLLIDGETGRIFGEISARLAAAGRAADFRVQDLWIASQAIQHNHRLLTRNEKDFKDIPGLDLVLWGAPPSPAPSSP
jgi:predicted nucleic acid-binding protein